MITRTYGKIEVQCDYCDEVLATNTADFDTARTKLLNEGWLSRRWGWEWKHSCPECAK